MENVTKFMEKVFSAIMFLVATSFLLYQTNLTLEVLKENKASLTTEVLYDQYAEIEVDNITYAELVSTLFYDLEYDVQINTLLISKYDHIDVLLKSYNIPDTIYTRSYAYDINGSITRVIYKSADSI